MNFKSSLNRRIVPAKQAQKFAKQNNLEYFEVSAKENLNIDEIFLEMTCNILEKIEDREINVYREHGIKIGALEIVFKQPDTKILLKQKVIRNGCCGKFAF